MDIVLVSGAGLVKNEPTIINQLFDAKLKILHLRKPDMLEHDFRRLLDRIEPQWYPRIAIHQHYHLAEEYGIRKLHFPEHSRQSLTVSKLREFSDAGFRFSTSVHTLSKITVPDTDPSESGQVLIPDSPDAGLLLSEGLDYIFYGPVFDSISKKGYNGMLEEAFKLPPHRDPVIGIGGVTPEKLEQMFHMGFDGAAVLGHVWHNSVSPAEAWERLLNKQEF